jgi:hypothetical protein
VNNIIKTFSDISDWNLALHIWDNEKIVINNRKNLASKLNKDLEDFIYMNQIHSVDIVVVWKNEKWLWIISINDAIKCDWLVTREKWIVLSVLVADCLPILFYDDINKVIGVAHAWWKWTNKDILKNTINKMLELSANINNLKIIIWPSINQCSYEIWEEVWEKFRNEVKTDLINQKQYLDLKKENKLQALELWIKEDNIEIINIDTFSDKNYFSARRDWFKRWRFGWFIYIK